MNCLLCGVGGQGTVLASKLIAQTAMSIGQTARTAETIGMAQRGGSVVSHVRCGDDVFSSLIPLKTADVIIGFEPAEAVRCLPYLKDGGTVIISNKAIKPVTAALSVSSYDGNEMIAFLKENVSNLYIVNSDKVYEKTGSLKVLNIALLGVALKAKVFDFSIGDMENTIKEKVKEQFVALNIEALNYGFEGGFLVEND